MCHPFFGYSRGGPHRVREIIATANTSLVEDEYGFRYYLVTEKDVDIAQNVAAHKGHNGTKLTFVHVVPNRGLDTGLYHTDDSWEKRVIGKLFFVVMERDHSRPWKRRSRSNQAR